MIDGTYQYATTKSGFRATKKLNNTLVYFSAPRKAMSVSRDGFLIELDELNELLAGLQLPTATATIANEKKENENND